MSDENDIYGFGILNEGQAVTVSEEVMRNIRLSGCCTTTLIDFDKEEVNGDHETFVRLVTLFPHLLKDPKK